MSKIPFKDQFNYKFDNYLSKGTMAMINGLAILALVIIIVFGILLIVFNIHPEADKDLTFAQSLFLHGKCDPGSRGRLGWKRFALCNETTPRTWGK